MEKYIILIFLTIPQWMNQSSGVETFAWLTGTWEMKKPNGSSRFETWMKKDDHTLTGKGFKVTSKDTVILEAIELVYKDDFFWYIPTVPDQNNALPVPFKLEHAEGFKYTFENLQHDFPQRIIYQLKPIIPRGIPTVGDTLFVRVEALNGKSIDYHFLRK